MSYRVEYTPQTGYSSAQKGGSALGILMTLTVFALFLFVLHNYFPAYWTGLQGWLWPGASAVTQDALKTMVAELNDGIPFSQAAAAFCMEIFRNAGIH